MEQYRPPTPKQQPFVRYEPPTPKLIFKSNNSYHVFLSFRGPDVRKTLVDHLYQALSAAGLNVFLDSHKLEKGEIIGLTLEKAIESSAICIPIFSEGYADSVWCLKEAAAMLRSPGSIIPLFYHVDPTDVRHPESDSSPYKESFLKHHGHAPNRYSKGEIDGWKHALKKICEHSGWSMDITEGYEARLVKTVVNDLIMTLDRVPLHVAKHPVGIINVKDAIIQKLNLNSVDDVVKIGIWGIGGIGKTTVAKAVYNEVYASFNAASFVFNVRATAAKATGLEELQTKVLRDLCNYDEKVVHGVSQGISLFQDRLRRNRVLLILDDVDTVEQLNAFGGDWLTSGGDWLAPGSRVIITSRNKHILNVARVSSECVHEMSGLELTEALHLFSWHAFLGPSPRPKYEDLSKEIVEACKGHPLSLEVIGCSLFDKQGDKSCWRETLDNIKHNQDIYDGLIISYDTLSKVEKEIFVDIACFFIGEKNTLPIIFWKFLYDVVEGPLSNLKLKSLIEIKDGVFHMHDRLQDMGRVIAEKEEKRTRQWKVDHLSTISNNINLSRLRLRGGNPQRLEVLNSSVLRYLHLQNLSIQNMTEDTLAMLPRSLIWLRLEHCPFAIGRNRSAVDEPRHSRYMDNIWELKVMQLKDCADLDSVFLSSLFSPPNDLSQLQHLDLTCCKRLTSLPDTIGNLSQLQHLDLGWCDRLNNLPDTIGNLSQLQQLNLERCVSLDKLPDTIGDLTRLERLNLESCRNLNNLPSSIGNLSQLQNLNLRCCDRLSRLPDGICNLAELKNLYLGKCESLDSLPINVGDLCKLQHLDLEGCIELKYLPSTIGNMSELQHLDIKWCKSLTNLPNAIADLPKLQLFKLSLRGCESLCKIPPRIFSRLQKLEL
ncbi:hypothetical protein SUGI_1215060 [Cryptomeria japonica]|uniref:TIR domain-containing protein n=1 Tax=Cryptomeria japonica TaxID=3369 RepID=A0AAD3RM93_CRYJA|nr:disease resistance protein RUN1 [Cryptomeria japonica]GLJ56287.1 hypothetical protein SUGI_1215060 [Cryptomeria japonica]